MKRPTTASLKKVTAENLANLGVERLAEILVAAAEARPELKRRLRMELAAEQGAEHLAVEIDRRLGSLQTSRSKVPWRQRPTFVRDLDVLRLLIADRLAGLDRPGALERMWQFMDIARRVGLRVRDRDGELANVFDRAAADIGAMIGGEVDPAQASAALVEALVRDPTSWSAWLHTVLEQSPPELAAQALRRLSERPDPKPGWMVLVRQLADASGDIDAYRASWPAAALKTPAVAAGLGQRLLGAGRLDEAGALLQASAPAKPKARLWPLGRDVPDPDFDWESAWIDYLDLAGRADEAQAARWASFERTLSAERAKAFAGRLSGFDDVEAEGRAFALAAGHADFQRGLQLLMDWPALGEAGRMILARPDDIEVTPDQAELWAARLRAKQPAAAHLLLRKAAAAAFRRREFKTSDRLTQEADAIAL